MACVACLAVALLLAASVHCRVDDEPAMLWPGAGDPLSQVHNDGCKVCGVFVDMIQDALEDPRVEDWLLDVVEHSMCPRLPESLEEKCVENAPTFVPDVIHWLEGITNTALCSDIDVCGPAALDSVVVQEDQDEDFDCTVCKNLTAIVKKEAGKVQPDTLVDKIEQLKEQCDELGNEGIQDRCKQLIDKYGYMLVYFIEREKDQDIDKACADLGMCPMLFKTPVIDPIPSDLVKKMMGYRAASNATDKCQRCKAVAQDALDDLANPDTQRAVAAFISKPCTWVPAYEAECTSAMTNITINVLNDIATDTTADEACTNLAFCGGHKDSPEWYIRDESVQPAHVY
ncbi:unnamed protein product [Ostreobium quekettii]|uniref:Saposin B-type domain-containing protein n=1 Tax=Ostreobium quekettii TaxID=121088 RepID=A0A8S1J5J5_9CHLO|nr:unnamed protein product [Ostreobium quekettii]|eukprot:evm.model.scf_2877.1 EVM.evm.TU.scf_2877.1   scf_2877:1412-5682(+)